MCTVRAKFQPIVLSITILTIPVGSAYPQNEAAARALESERAIQSLIHSERVLQLRPLIAPGEPKETTAYYARISAAGILNFDFLNSDLNKLMVYLGYAQDLGGTLKGLLAQDLEGFASFDLMPRNDAEFDQLEKLISNADPQRTGFDGVLTLADFQSDKVLVSRFFAPKIVTYFYADDPTTPEREDNTPIARDDIQRLNGAGWRKLIRLKPRSGSEADKAKVKVFYLLFNFKEKNPAVDPYMGKESANNQVIIVPLDQDQNDSCYFAVYGSRSMGYPIGLFLGADFDLPGQNVQDAKYYVPRACAECHGHSSSVFADDMRGDPVDANGTITADFKTGTYPFAKPNYLDTDQWYDWMDFDFREAASGLNDVLFDGTKDHGSAEYQRAFSIVRAINADIRNETFNAERSDGIKSYQTLAVEKWNDLHATDNNRKPYSLRSIGTEFWDKTSSDEMTLLRLLNNHCFRCHSSVRYNIFDKAAFRETSSSGGLTRKAIAQVYLNQANSNGVGNRMPQGRVLLAEDRLEMNRLLDNVFGP